MGAAPRRRQGRAALGTVRRAAALLPLLAPALLGAQRAAARDGAGAPDTAAVALVTTFLDAWRTAWQTSEKARHPTVDTEGQPPLYRGNVRLQRLHCHGGPTQVVGRWRMRVCPAWVPSPDSIPRDERLGVDLALVPAQRDSVRRLRARLLDTLARLAASPAPPAWLPGQRVRFLVDQGDTSAARTLVRACGDDWRCLLLAGWLDHRAGAWDAAELAFARALAGMPDDERCRWEDVEPLLADGDDRRRWRALPCARRLEEAQRFWWLADPLWSEPGNARRTEHMARQVLVALRSRIAQDDRMHWSPRYGGDAVREMVLRYGWPSYFWWAGAFQDDDHYRWTQDVEQRWGVAPRATFWAPEYSAGRLHLAPDAAAWRAPMDTLPWREARIAAPARDAQRWWPHEHWVPDAPLAALADVQVALLRRQHETRVVAATDPAALDGRRILLAAGDTARAALLLAAAPDSVVTVAESRLATGAPAVLAGSVQRAGAALLALELSPAHAAAAPRAPRRRARLAVHVPAPLAALGHGERAVSAPALVRPAAEGTALDEREATVLAGLLGTTTLPSRARVGVYWESYGFAAADTVRVTLRVVRHRDGVLARLGRALHVPGFGAEGRDATATAWSEGPRPEAMLAAGDGAVPVRQWARTLDLRALPAGRYHVEVTVAGGGRAATGRRDFAVGR